MESSFLVFICFLYTVPLTFQEQTALIWRAEVLTGASNSARCIFYLHALFHASLVSSVCFFFFCISLIIFADRCACDTYLFYKKCPIDLVPSTWWHQKPVWRNNDDRAAWNNLHFRCGPYVFPLWIVCFAQYKALNGCLACVKLRCFGYFFKYSNTV